MGYHQALLDALFESLHRVAERLLHFTTAADLQFQFLSQRRERFNDVQRPQHFN